ncbi:hypothetical protein ACFYM2_08755 [Streptomyces sp. NPDC006711]|uniref:hypothetical protein n=1 Tax=unclassified Streptomyces TaxID=2593676 RepID=UPI0033C06F4F
MASCPRIEAPIQWLTARLVGLAVAEIDAVEHESGDLGDPAGVNCRAGEDELCTRGGRSRDGALDLLGEERLQHGVLVLRARDHRTEGRARLATMRAFGLGQ